jgi:hypothetical protein
MRADANTHTSTEERTTMAAMRLFCPVMYLVIERAYTRGANMCASPVVPEGL